MKKFFKDLWNDESGQGMVEYMLLVVVVIALVTLFKDPIKEAVDEQVQKLGGDISGFTGK